MAQQTIDLGTVANDGTGDTLREGGDKINDNFTELYGNVGVLQTHTFPGGTLTHTFTLVGTPGTIEIELFGRSVSSTLNESVGLRVNGLSTNIYNEQRVFAQNATAGGAQSLLASSLPNAFNIPGASVTDTDTFGGGDMKILGCQSAKFKSYLGGGWVTNHATTGNGFAIATGGQIKTTAAITTVTIFAAGNFVAGSKLILREKA